MLFRSGIPTSLVIKTKDGKTYDSKMVMFPSGHARNTLCDLKGILNHKFHVLGKLALEPAELDTFLNKLNNIDKHRRINVIGTSFNGFCVHPVVNKILREKVKANPSIIGTTPAGFWFRPEHDRSPLKVGDKLYGCPSDSKLDEDVQFAFEIAFNEPSVGECKPVVLLLDKTAKRIQSLIDQFA